jgi:hypothetical protein
MPVQKFRSIEEMNRAPVRTSEVSDFDRFLRHCARFWAIAPRVYPRGVFKFRCIEDVRHPDADGPVSLEGEVRSTLTTSVASRPDAFRRQAEAVRSATKPGSRKGRDSARSIRKERDTSG